MKGQFDLLLKHGLIVSECSLVVGFGALPLFQCEMFSVIAYRMDCELRASCISKYHLNAKCV